MHHLHVEIVRWVDSYQPGIVAAEFCDAEGTPHTIVDKAPMFTSENLDGASDYPRAGHLRCTVLDRPALPDGEQGARITLEEPDDLESTSGVSIFVVRDSQLSPA